MIGAGVLYMYVCMHVYIYMCDLPKSMNGTLAVDLPFQTLTVGLLIKFID